MMVLDVIDRNPQKMAKVKAMARRGEETVPFVARSHFNLTGLDP